MFVGHYAVSFALKRFEKRASLAVLFLAVQFLDILFFPFVLLGIERMAIVPGFTASTNFDLEYLPYTHSLLAALLWSVLAYVVFRWIVVRNQSVAVVVAIAVFSHWVLDLVVHTPDLPLWSDSSPKLGLGLWNNAAATYILEAALLIGGLWLYLGATSASTRVGKYGMGVFVALLLAINAVNIFGPPMGDSRLSLAVSAVTFYLLFAAMAFWLDRRRA